MIKRLAVLVGIIWGITVYAQTTVPGGNVSGVWTAPGSPYLIEGDIHVPMDSTLTIDPGISVIFQGHYNLVVGGLLLAEGIESDSIYFIPMAPDSSWSGIDFDSTASSLCVMEYCYITGGNAQGEWPDNAGGGILCYYSSPTIENCTITGNTAEWGGGIYYYGSSRANLTTCVVSDNSSNWGGGIGIDLSNPTIASCTIENNHSEDDGGGIACYEASPTIFSCTVSGNQAIGTGGYPNGGGLYFYSNCNAIVSNCSIWGNLAESDGGGINCNTASPTISNCNINDNRAINAGGGINCCFNSSPLIEFCDISYDTSDWGGGISGWDNSNPIIDNCEIDCNFADWGGGIGFADSEPTFSNCNIRWNSSTGAGGIDLNGVNANLTDCEISWNSAAEYGGGIIFSNGAQGNITNCNISENTSAYGAGIHCDYSTPVITNNDFTSNSASTGGGAISLSNSSDATIMYNSFTSNNTPAYVDPAGGAIVCGSSNPTISSNVFTSNSASYGGAINCYYYSDATIADNIFKDNVGLAFGGGAINLSDNADGTVSGNVFVQNTSSNYGGGGICCYQNSCPLIINNTFTSNLGAQGGAIYCHQSSPNLTNCILWGNNSPEIALYGSSNPSVTFSDVQGGWPGTGNIDTDPLFVAPVNGDYHLQSIYGSFHNGAWLPDPNHSPCIDAGDPASPFTLEPEPNGGIVNMGAYGNTEEASLSGYQYWPDMIIELTYVSGSPVSASGGSLTFDIFVDNLEPDPVDFEAWLAVEYEGGTPTTLLMRTFFDFQPTWMINRPGMYYPVPQTWAAGNYNFWGRVGVEPLTVWDESSFPFVKLGTDYLSGFIPDPVDGAPNPFDEIIKTGTREAPSQFVLNNAYPNPFNPSTAISYQLSANSFVNLSVYDISGRLVAELVNGWRNAGVHEVTFDASGLASGMYFYRIEAGDYSSVRKMVLVK